MRKVKVKRKEVKLVSDDQDFLNVFETTTGLGSIDIKLAYPKWLRLEQLLDRIDKLFSAVIDSPFMNDKKKEVDELNQFLSAGRAVMGEVKSLEIHSDPMVGIADFKNVSESAAQEFEKKYLDLKHSEFVSQLIVMCDRLVPFKKSIMDAENLSYQFILQMPGVEWSPFPFCSLNVKQVFINRSQGDLAWKEDSEFFIVVLHKALVISYEIWREVMSPDIDYDNFIRTFLESTKSLEKVPELSRCGAAFNMIRKSIDLFKDRVAEYHRDFVMTGSSQIILENFIIDITKSTSVNPSVSAQFTRIIRYFRKIAGQRGKVDPKINSLFKHANDQLMNLQKDLNNLPKSNRPLEEDDEIVIPEEPEEEKEDEELMQARVRSASKSVDDLVKEINGASKKGKRKK